MGDSRHCPRRLVVGRDSEVGVAAAKVRPESEEQEEHRRGSSGQKSSWGS